jgi:myo-inositol 2-dehydrogenase/D-chiro-inositol 1-dehydrogenase
MRLLKATQSKGKVMKNTNIETKNKVSRRDFIKTSATGVAAVLAANKVIFAQPAKRTLKVALLGCGGRGQGALGDCLKAATFIDGLELQIVGLADYFEPRTKEAAEKFEVPESKCIVGANAYKKLMETDADVIVTATPPIFRPPHLEAAIEAGKHVFMEKPVGVDPPGIRRIIAAGELAKQKGLAIVAGTQRRHQANYRRTAYAVEKGAIGKIRGGCIWWCGGELWYRTREEGESDADYMVRNWVSFTEMSGDHIVEQHVHNIDVANWFIGHPPVRALGFGGRARRKTGNQFDFHSVEFDYADDLHIHSMCRQINGCYNRVMEHFVGSEGSTTGDGGNMDSSKNIDLPNFPEHEGPYCQEHVDLLNSILKEEPLNEARNVAESTLTAIMGRIATYTGQMIRWSDVAENTESQWYNLTLKPTPEDFENGNVVAPPDDVVAIPGSEERRRRG